MSNMICGRCHKPVIDGFGYLIQRTYDKQIETIAIIPCHATCDPNIPFMGKQSLESLVVQLGSERTLNDFCLDLRKDNLYEIMQDAFACWRGVEKFKRQCRKQKGSTTHD